MTIPEPGQTVHLMGFLDVICVRCQMHRKNGRSVRELEFYTTDDLRRLYQNGDQSIIPLRDGIVTRIELAAEIRWRIAWQRFGYVALAFASIIAAIASVVAAIEGA